MDTVQNRTSIPDEAPQQARSRATYASFGDNGTTATANAYGHLLQITRYFGNKPSGFFCADLPFAPEPCFVEGRMDYLQDSCQKASRGMRLLLDNTENSEMWRAETYTDAVPKMSFLQDRWPSFTKETPAFHLNIQYLIFQSAVYQIYTFKLKEGSLILPEIPKLAINANLLLRNLNFTEDDEENEREGNDEHYKHLILNDGHLIATVHKVDQIKSAEKDAVGLFMSIFINGRLQTFKAAEHSEVYKDFDDLEDFEDLEDCKYYEITPDPKTAVDLSEQKSLKVTVAYKLDIVSSAALMDMYPIYSRESLLQAENIIEHHFTVIPFSENEHLNFILRRNLEHILSACSIPISEFLENNATPARSDTTGLTTIALTCGDFSGHRIAATASFYAFEFLVKALKHLQQNNLGCSCLAGSRPCEDYACKLGHRIRVTCRGHLKWLSSAHMRTHRDLLSTGYWASGEPISGWESSSEIPLTNTLFNFIKAASFCQIAANEQTKKDIAVDFQDMISFLINHLHQKNKNFEYIFPRYKDKKPFTYFTSDHAIIWWAIKSAEEIGLGPRCYVPQNIERGQHGMSYSSTKIQQSMITKLATENLNARKIMLATSRSFSENKFLLGTDDTILFHTMAIGIFNTIKDVEENSNIWQNKVDVWKNTVDYQGQREDHTVWTSPLQFALHSMMPANNKRMDSQPAEEVHNFARSILFSSSSPNGLFPGQLDESQQPVLLDNSASYDSYWHATFEVPYIMWSYQIQQSMDQRLSDSRLSKRSQTISQINEQMVMTNTNWEMSTHKGNVNEIPDRWLFDEPSFFSFNQDLSVRSIKQFCKNYRYQHCGTVIDEAILHGIKYEAFKSLINGYIIDIPKKNGLYTREDIFWPRNVTESYEVRQHIGGTRTPAIAKKRFLHFYPINQEIALSCYLASSEKDAISLFLDRHALYDRHFSEDAILVLNKWVTELHLPFYQITRQQPSSGDYQTISDVVSIRFMRSIWEDGDAMWINRATMSFRFDGDILDRYWTCYFIENNPKNLTEGPRYEYGKQNNPYNKITKRVDGASKRHSWGQRRILELILFDLILEEILTSTKEILKESQTCIERSFKSGGFGSSSRQASNSIILDPLSMVDKVDNDNFLSTNKLWNELEPIFQLVKNSLDENLATINSWMEREKERKRDDLQWTLNDERDYRGAISTLQVLNRHKVDKLERYSANIASFNAAFAKKLKATRSELDRRGADDIRLFTYVTVVFLPVGFATSVFSMSGSPSGDTLHGMIIVAILALLLTSIALVNARILERVLRPMFRACRAVTEAIVNPIISGLSRLIHPISKPVYLFLCRSVYGIAFPLYMRFLSPEDARKNDQDPETNDDQTEKQEQGTEHYGKARKSDMDAKQKHYKQITELGPIRIARRNIMIMRSKKKEKHQQEMREIEREIRQQKEEKYRKAEENNFKERGLLQLIATIRNDVTQKLEKELKDAVEEELERKLEAVRNNMGEISAIKKKRVEDKLREDLRPPINERLTKEGRTRIRRQTDIIIENRVKIRIEREVREHMKKKRSQKKKERRADEESKRQDREATKTRGGFVSRIFGKASRGTLVKSAGGELEERILSVA